MMRSMSHQTHAEAAPSLLSSASAPSLPSASSSTAGSPYSGHAQLASNHFMYNNQFITGPAIICDDSFPYSYESAHFDHEATIAQDAKLTPPFVGKSAYLSSFVQGSAAKPVQQYLPSEPLVSSPKPISAMPSIPTIFSTKQNQSAENAATQVTSIATSLKSHSSGSNAVFKSPTTPASAYPKTPSPNVGKATYPSVKPSRDSFRFSYSFPFSSDSPMSQHGYKPHYNLLSHSDGNFTLPIETSCSSFLFSALFMSLSMPDGRSEK